MNELDYSSLWYQPLNQSGYLDFTPTFLADLESGVSPSVLAAVDELCGNNTLCRYDYLREGRDAAIKSLELFDGLTVIRTTLGK